MSDHTPGEARELGRRALEELGAAAGGIGGIHRAIAGRAFRHSGPGARPAQLAHDAISGAVYATVAATARGLGHAAGHMLPDRPVSTTPRGAAVLGMLNGLIGDELHAQRSPLAQDMTVRVDGRPVPIDRDALASAFAGASGRIVVFVHGLMESERAWWLRAERAGGTYATRLEQDLGVTAVHVRYNTGLRISANGRALARILDDLVAAWPAEVTGIALVGHSMGGLVARSACHYAGEQECGWAAKVTHTVTLGTPHMGAPLAQGVHYLSAALDRLPETRPLANFLRRRSEGIHDLRHGSLVDEDWQGRDKHDLSAAALNEIPLLEGATHCFVSASVTRSPAHPIGRLVGDMLVLQASASGRSRSRRIGFEEEHGAHVGGAGHLALLNHPDVYEHLRRWLSRERQPQLTGA